VIQRLYVNNFRCLENFDLSIAGQASTLLVGKNGAGKTTVSSALKVLQKIARGTNRVRELVLPQDFSRGQTDIPMRFEIEVKLIGNIFHYVVAFELPKGFKELRIFQERLSVDGSEIYSREIEKVSVITAGKGKQSTFMIDWHLVALPLVQEGSAVDPLAIFRKWLSQVLILRPLPSLITGDASGETLQPNDEVTNLGTWFTGVMALSPSAYTKMDSYLRQIMPDLQDIRNITTGSDSKSLMMHFSSEQGRAELPFKYLSDGEKCYMICALVLAAHSAYGPLFCFWDEPDNHLALSEVGHFILTLRKAFKDGGQFIATSHNPEAIRRFSEENTLLLDRRSHLEPTIVRRLSELQISGDTVGAMLRGDLTV
jgi:predicted ATPase